MDKLYQDALKAHYSTPTGQNRNINATHSSEGYNASCGDEICIELQLNETTIEDIAFESDSCAICTASASILCEVIKQKDLDCIPTIYHQLQAALNNTTSDTADLPHQQLEILQPIKQYPSRINCALLPWQTVIEALKSPINSQRNLTTNA